MAQYFVDIPWTKQPPAGTQIDWDNPITKGLVFCAPDQAGREVVTGAMPQFTRTGNYLNPENMGRFGSVIASRGDGGGTGGGRFYSDKYAQAQCWDKPGFTMWSLQRSNNYDSWETPFGIDYNAAGGSPYFVGYSGSPDNSQIYYTVSYTDNTSNRIVTPTTPWPKNRLSTLALRFDRYETNRMQMFVDNIVVDTDLGSDKNIGWPSETNSDTICINDWDQAINQDQFGGPVALALMWNRALTDAELSALEENPWQIFEPQRIPIYPPAGAVAPDVDVAAALSAALTVAADVNASGTLSAAQQLALTVAADLSAQGRLDAAAAIALAVNASIEAATNNDVDAALDIALTTAPTLSAEGTLATALQAALTATPTLNALGSLAANTVLVLSLAADLAASGKLEAANDIVLQLVADIDAAGELRAATAIALDVAASLSAQGKLEASTAIALTTLAAVADGNSEFISAALNAELTVNAVVTATGELLSTAGIALTVTADITDANALIEAIIGGGGSGGRSKGHGAVVMPRKPRDLAQSIDYSDAELLNLAAIAIVVIEEHEQ